MRHLARASLIVIMIATLNLPVHAGVWDMDLPYPGDDPHWSPIKTQWDKHWDGKNLGGILADLNAIHEQHPQDLETLLWLSKVYYLKARFDGKDRQTNLRQSELYAVKAYEMDGNLLALKLLVDAMCMGGDTMYTLARHGDWIRGAAPWPTAEALPPLPRSEAWRRFQVLWAGRAEIERALAAVKILEDVANSQPRDALSQIWACRGNYYLGLYYTSLGGQDGKARRFYGQGVLYGEKALVLQPYSVPANYWYQVNLAGDPNRAGFWQRWRQANTLVRHALFCSRENDLYYYCGPVQTLGLLYAKGGWWARQRIKGSGMSPEIAMSALDMAGIMYPGSLGIPYAKAQMLIAQGQRAEALKTLEGLLGKKADSDKLIAPENLCWRRLVRQLALELKKG